MGCRGLQVLLANKDCGLGIINTWQKKKILLCLKVECKNSFLACTSKYCLRTV
ncbi:putative translation initiation factor IF-1 [Bacteroides fragilis str. S6L5]|nr:putative translation initiation factor IF-1 [Bacteroides fragilis str. S6L5]